MKRTFIVTGSSSGLGKELRAKLEQEGNRVFGYDLKNGQDVRCPVMLPELRERPLDCLINCAGVNLISWLEDLSARDFNATMDTNARAIFQMTQLYLANLIEAKGTVVNIVSNAAHVPMTCSAAYNASKAAALMLTKQLARELTPKYGITVFSVSPNKLAGTAMSRDIERQVCVTRGWSEEFAAEYQRKALLTGEETPPELVAEFITFLLSAKERHKYLSGCDIPYGA